MYGSLTTIALIMLWLYFCMYIMMMSAEDERESSMKASGNGSSVTGQRKKGLSFEKCCVRIAIEFDADHGHQK